MVAVGVGDEDRLDRLALDRREDRGEMVFVAGTRVEDGDCAPPQNIGARAVEGEGRRVRRDQTADERRELSDFARRRLPRIGEKLGFLVLGHALSSFPPCDVRSPCHDIPPRIRREGDRPVKPLETP